MTSEVTLNSKLLERRTECFTKAYYAKGEVVQGHGRGRTMNCKTANIDPTTYATTGVEKAEQGVFWGWTRRSHEETPREAVISFGINPHFGDVDLILEAHVLHEYEEDFYGEELEVWLVGYMRPMAKFTSLEALVQWIDNDKIHASQMLQLEESRQILAQFRN